MREARARAIPWLQRVGLGERLDHTPAGELLRGEHQRVAIARARRRAAADPGRRADREPRQRPSREIVELLHAIARERDAAVLLVTHDLEAAAIADRRCTLRDGRLSVDRRALRAAVSALSPSPQPGRRRAPSDGTPLADGATLMGPRMLVSLYRRRLRAHGARRRGIRRGGRGRAAVRGDVADGSLEGSAREVVHAVIGPASLQLRARVAPKASPNGGSSRAWNSSRRQPGHAAARTDRERARSRRASLDGADRRAVSDLGLLDGLAHTIPLAAFSADGIELTPTPPRRCTCPPRRPAPVRPQVGAPNQAARKPPGSGRRSRSSCAGARHAAARQRGARRRQVRR